MDWPQHERYSTHWVLYTLSFTILFGHVCVDLLAHLQPLLYSFRFWWELGHTTFYRVSIFAGDLLFIDDKAMVSHEELKCFFL